MGKKERWRGKVKRNRNNQKYNRKGGQRRERDSEKTKVRYG